MIKHCLSVVIACLFLTGAKSMLSTAKIGGNGGFAFTDETLYNANGAFSALKIWIDSRYHVINAIQAQYGSTWAPAHGANGGFYGSPQTVTLQAGESITAATLASLSAPGVATCVCYLKFETNQGRTLGPFDCGCGAGSATRFDLGDGLAYLSGNSGNSLDAIVLNYLPACVASIKTQAQAGGNGGFAFSDQSAFATNGNITGLNIWIDPSWKTINAIQVQYGSELASIHGGGNGLVGSPQVISLEATETITAMTLNSLPPSSYAVCICYILIETSAGKTFGPYDGGCGAATATRYTLDRGLAYIDGRSGNSLDALTLNYRSCA